MDQAGIIRDLLSWLEGHPGSAAFSIMWRRKAGYSSGICSECLRMSPAMPSVPIFARAACRNLLSALRLTARPILDIALQYRFDSQQTFTRAFKKQFSLTPALYRRSPDWSSFGWLRPPLRLGEFTLPKHEFITLPPTQLLGVTQSYTCKPRGNLRFFVTRCGSSSGETSSATHRQSPRCSTGCVEPRPSLEKTMSRKYSIPPR